MRWRAFERQRRAPPRRYAFGERGRKGCRLFLRCGIRPYSCFHSCLDADAQRPAPKKPLFLKTNSIRAELDRVRGLFSAHRFGACQKSRSVTSMQCCRWTRSAAQIPPSPAPGKVEAQARQTLYRRKGRRVNGSLSPAGSALRAGFASWRLWIGAQISEQR